MRFAWSARSKTQTIARPGKIADECLRKAVTRLPRRPTGLFEGRSLDVRVAGGELPQFEDHLEQTCAPDPAHASVHRYVECDVRHCGIRPDVLMWNKPDRALTANRPIVPLFCPLQGNDFRYVGHLCGDDLGSHSYT